MLGGLSPQGRACRVGRVLGGGRELSPCGGCLFTRAGASGRGRHLSGEMAVWARGGRPDSGHLVAAFPRPAQDVGPPRTSVLPDVGRPQARLRLCGRLQPRVSHGHSDLGWVVGFSQTNRKIGEPSAGRVSAAARSLAPLPAGRYPGGCAGLWCQTRSPTSCQTRGPAWCRTRGPASCRTRGPGWCPTGSPAWCRTRSPASCQTGSPAWRRPAPVGEPQAQPRHSSTVLTRPLPTSPLRPDSGGVCPSLLCVFFSWTSAGDSE